MGETKSWYVVGCGFAEWKRLSSSPLCLYLPHSSGPVGLCFPLSWSLLRTKPSSELQESLAWQDMILFSGVVFCYLT